MIVICEECGKKYRVDPTKIKGKAASFKCHICNHVIMVYTARMPSTQADSKMAATSTARIRDASGAVQDDKIDNSVGADKASAGRRRHRKTGGAGLRTKMLLVFLFIPLILMAGGSIFYLWYFETASDLLVQENSSIATELAEQKIADIRAASARMQTQAKEVIDRVRWVTLIVFGVTLLFIILIVSIYVYRLTGKIQSLVEIAERIGVGELEVEIETRSGDEIGELSRALSSIQEKIQLSIARLQQRQ
jgi:predicted Zn finger-like uncharacterized protein